MPSAFIHPPPPGGSREVPSTAACNEPTSAPDDDERIGPPVAASMTSHPKVLASFNPVLGTFQVLGTETATFIGWPLAW
jgi:hypothetical protein